jgi:hypothetical protein
VAALVAEIEAISVDELSVKGRNAQTDTHYYGLARTVTFAAKRLEAAVGVAPAAKEAAVALLAVLARLPTDGAAAAELFKVPDDEMHTTVQSMFFNVAAAGSDYSPRKSRYGAVARHACTLCPLPPPTVVDLFRESAWSVAFAPACALLARFGLVRGGERRPAAWVDAPDGAAVRARAPWRSNRRQWDDGSRRWEQSRSGWWCTAQHRRGCCTFMGTRGADNSVHQTVEQFGGARREARRWWRRHASVGCVCGDVVPMGDARGGGRSQHRTCWRRHTAAPSCRRQCAATW